MGNGGQQAAGARTAGVTPGRYEDGEFSLFESGAIVFHIAERHAGLLPTEGGLRAKAICWTFAALNTVEPPIVERDYMRYKSWQAERFAMVDERIRARFDQLAAAFGASDSLKQMVPQQVARRRTANLTWPRCGCRV